MTESITNTISSPFNGFESIESAINNIRKTTNGKATLLLATKCVDPERINYAISCGITHIGENRVNELLEKYESI